jgi:hypothetical protein
MTHSVLGAALNVIPVALYSDTNISERKKIILYSAILYMPCWTAAQKVHRSNPDHSQILTHFEKY